MPLFNILVIISLVVLTIVLITAMVLAVELPSAYEIDSAPVPPNLLCQRNVQQSLARLQLNVSNEYSGLMTPGEKAKLDAVPTPFNGGVILYEYSKFASVTVLSSFPGGSNAGGSGFVHRVVNGNAYIVTCAHAVLQDGGMTSPLTPASLISVCLHGINGDVTNDQQINVNIVGVDAAADIAVLVSSGNIFTQDQRVLSFATGNGSLPGSTVFVVGDPSLNDPVSIAGGTLRDNKYLNSQYGGSIESISFSAPIESGNSGGPVISDTFSVIGLSNWTLSSGSSTSGGGVNSYIASRVVASIIATDADYVKSYAGCLSSSVVAGMQLERLRVDYPGFIGTPNGLVIKSLDSMGLSTAGALVDDIIIQVNGVDIGVYEDEYSPTRVTWFESPGTTIPFTMVRPSDLTGAEFTINVTLSAFPSTLDVVLCNSF